LVERAKLLAWLADISAEPFAIVVSRKGTRMAFISLGEALDRVLEKLAVERGEKEAGGIETARQLAPAEGRITGRGKQGGEGRWQTPDALRQRGSQARVTGRPFGRRE
jgi:hypothetical protein